MRLPDTVQRIFSDLLQPEASRLFMFLNTGGRASLCAALRNISLTFIFFLVLRVAHTCEEGERQRPSLCSFKNQILFEDAKLFAVNALRHVRFSHVRFLYFIYGLFIFHCLAKVNEIHFGIDI
jgi:hypothetical protein